MATTKKTTTTAKSTKAKAESKPMVEEVVEVKKETIAKPTKTEKTYSPTDLIDCTSIWDGVIVLEGKKSNMIYKWQMVGDVVGVEYQDLILMINQRSQYITEPVIAINDMDIVEKYPQLKELYSKIYSAQEIKDMILDLNVMDLAETVKTLPKGVLESVKSIAATMVSRGELDSINKINNLDSLLGTNLKFLADFEN